MPKAKLLYLSMLVVIIGFIVYVVYMNFFHDPQASEFLSHKSNLKRPVNPPEWLTVMNVHVAFACMAMVSGAVNFSNKMLRTYRKFHRINGYVYLTAVIVVDVTSGYMAPYATGGKPISIAFNLLNIIWLAMTITALVQIKKKQVNSHRKWMVRSYVFCFTNMFIHLITFIFHNGFDIAYSTGYTIGVYGSILLLLIVAEIVNRTIFKIPTAINRSESV